MKTKLLTHLSLAVVGALAGGYIGFRLMTHQAITKGEANVQSIIPAAAAGSALSMLAGEGAIALRSRFHRRQQQRQINATAEQVMDELGLDADQRVAVSETLRRTGEREN